MISIKTTEPLIKYFKDLSLLEYIDANRDLKTISSDIKQKWLDDDVEYNINVLFVKPYEGQIISQKIVLTIRS